MRCVVTGANGFIGNALVQRLASDGHEVYALYRRTVPAVPPGVVPSPVDITDPSGLPAVLKEAEVVFHCAALVRDYGPAREAYAVNFEGTRNVASACGPTLRCFVFLGHLPEPGRLSSYSASKKKAEDYLLQRYEEESFPAVVVRPGNVYGPGATTWVLRPLRAIQQGRLRLIDHGRGTFLHTYIDNLLDALVSVPEASRAVGRAIEVTDGDDSITWGRYFNDLACLAGRPFSRRSVPASVATVLSYGMLLAARLRGRPPLLTPMAVRLLASRRTTSLDDARALLGYHPAVAYEEGLRRTGQWLVQNQYL